MIGNLSQRPEKEFSQTPHDLTNGRGKDSSERLKGDSDIPNFKGTKGLDAANNAIQTGGGGGNHTGLKSRSKS